MKIKSSFRCQECGYSTARWLGRCPECERWNSFVEEQTSEAAAATATRRRTLTDFSSEISTLEETAVTPLVRTPTGIPEFDRVVGGGVVAGSMVLLGGTPGIGK